MQGVTSPGAIPGGVAGLRDSSRPAARTQNPKLRQACQEFEEVFLRMLLKEMRATVPDSGLLPQGLDKQIYSALLDENYARVASRAGGIGLAERLYQQLLPEIDIQTAGDSGRRSRTRQEVLPKATINLDEGS